MAWAGCAHTWATGFEITTELYNTRVPPDFEPGTYILAIAFGNKRKDKLYKLKAHQSSIFQGNWLRAGVLEVM